MSSLSLLGLLKHSVYVERWWFSWVFEGIDVAFPWTDDDPDADFRPEPDESAARAPAPGEPATLRGIMVHMIQETSRHLGHADIMREAIDGATGD